jgi:hypothetical protein
VHALGNRRFWPAAASALLAHRVLWGAAVALGSFASTGPFASARLARLHDSCVFVPSPSCTPAPGHGAAEDAQPRVCAAEHTPVVAQKRLPRRARLTAKRA